LAELGRLDGLIGGEGNKPAISIANTVSQTEKIRDWTEHVIGVEPLAEKLDTKLKIPGHADYFGLTENDAAERLRINGPNQLTEKKGIPWYIRFLLCMTGLFNYLLWAGSILCFISYGVQEDKCDQSNLYLGIVLAIVVVATATFAYS
jgi:sodium/potassium-transporting ATPase subunit alpha